MSDFWDSVSLGTLAGVIGGPIGAWLGIRYLIYREERKSADVKAASRTNYEEIEESEQ